MLVEDLVDAPIVEEKPVCPVDADHYVMTSEGAKTYHVWICYQCRTIFSKAPGGGSKGSTRRFWAQWGL